MNSNSNEAPNLCLNPDMKSIDPKIKQKMAESNKNVAIKGGMFLLTMISTVLSKSNILPGIALIKIDAIKILPMRFLTCSKFILGMEISKRITSFVKWKSKNNINHYV